MNFVEKILNYKSLSIVGIEKNTGKTETLNFILQNLKSSRKTVAVTSIGIDGENIDFVTNTPKPEIEVFDGMIFVTAEKYFLQKRFSADILDISRKETILGRLVTARALNNGKILLSGAADTFTLKKIIENNAELGADITVVDGALSRLSLASPAVTESMILTTGATYSINIDALVKKTKFVCQLIDLEKYTNINFNETDFFLSDHIKNGLYTLINNELYDLGVQSPLMISEITKENFEKLKHSNTLFVFGILSDKLIDFLIEKNIAKGISLIVKDFTNIFVSQEKFHLFKRFGGTINVLQKTKLLAVTVNPVSPQGYILDSEVLMERLQNVIHVPVFDLKKNVCKILEPV